jgi:hypothetical protein
MKEPSTPQVTYDGSLKELAARHLSLVKAVLFIFIIPIPLFIIGLGMEAKNSIPSSPYREMCEWAFLSAWLSGYTLVLYQTVRLIRLLFPFMWLTLSGIALFPITTLPMAIILLVCAVMQLRARGLHVGVLGIDPSRVEG